MSTDRLFTCPFCGKKKLYVSLVKPGHPWDCKYAYCPGIGGRTSGLARELPFAPSDYQGQGESNYQGEEQEDNKPQTFPLSEFHREYLCTTRHIPEWLVDSMPIYGTRSGILFEFPGFDYWQERRWKAWGNPRWNNKRGVGSSDGVFYLVDKHPGTTIILVEGIVDALSVGTFAPSACTLSYSLHPAQLKGLLDRGYDHMVYCPDNDVPVREIMRNQYVLSEAGVSWQLQRVPSNYKDPNEVPTEELEKWVDTVVGC